MSVIVQDLSKHFGAQKAVDNISFEAHPGEILGFLGPNGAGKTTTMKMICCFATPTQGSITVEGYNIYESPLTVRKQIGYLPEHNPLYDEMYIKEYLQFVASIHKIENKSKRIEEVIEMTGLGKEQNKIIGTLSKGYRQRVGIAQAIIHDPKVLILDEPTSGLDMNQLIDIRNLIKELSREKTVIFSSHIMQEVEALCDRVVIINDGHLVANESIKTLKNRMVGRQTVRVEFEDKQLALSKLDTVEMDITIKGGNGIFTFESSDKNDIRPAIFKFAVENQLVILEMTTEKANVEDIFRKLTKDTVYV